MSNGNRPRYQAARACNLLPPTAAKELLLRNAREDSELDNRRKQLDKERRELESHFSKARCRLLFRSNLSSQCQAVDFGVDHSSSDMKEDFDKECDGCDSVTVCSALSLEMGLAHSLTHSSEMEEEQSKVPQTSHEQQDTSTQSAIYDLNGKDRHKLRNRPDENIEFSSSQSVPESRINFDSTLNNCDTSHSFASCNLLPKRKLGSNWSGLENCHQNSEFSLDSVVSTNELTPSTFTQRRKISWHGRMDKNDPTCGTALSEKQHAQTTSDTGKSDKWETRSEYSSCSLRRRKLSWGGRMDQYDPSIGLGVSSEKQSEGKGSHEGKLDKSDGRSEYSSNPPPRRKISWGGKMPEKAETMYDFAFSNPLRRRKKSLSWGEADWESQSQISQPRSERNATTKTHSVLQRSKSYTKSSSEGALTKEALRNLRYSTSMQQGKKQDLIPDLNFTACYEDGKSPVEKPLSEILPPITLPPIYIQETNSRKKGNTKSKKNVPTNDSGFDHRTSVDDLTSCRYLRIRGATNREKYV